MALSNYISKVAIVGAGGHVGSFMAEALLKTGKHTITALTRADSGSTLPDNMAVKKIDYARPESIVEALKGQDALIITLSVLAPRGLQTTLISAAVEAGVPWVLPNEWSPDTANEGLLRDVAPAFQAKADIRKEIEALGKISYISVATGFWYEWSLAMRHAYGVDFANRTATLFDEGKTQICTSTWPQVGRALAALLSLPVRAEGSEACLDNYKNKVVYVNSFSVTQEDMLASAIRVTGTKRSDWTITKEPSHERYSTAVKEMRDGKREGFIKMMYTRVFYPDGSGDFEHKGTLNRMLGLPKEDLDEATKRAFERSKSPQ